MEDTVTAMSSNDPYRPPDTDVRPDDPASQLPDAPPPFGVSGLERDGFTALIGLLLSLPFGLSVLIPDLLTPLQERVLDVLSMLVSSYLTYALYRYLDYRFGAASLRTLTFTIISLGLIIGVLGLTVSPEETESVEPSILVIFVMLIPYGVANVVLGWRMRSLTSSHRPIIFLAWLTVVSGVMIASLVMLMMSIPLALAWYVVLAVVFFSGARELRSGGVQ